MNRWRLIELFAVGSLVLAAAPVPVALAWNEAGLAVEAHFYEKGGHGRAIGTTGAGWFAGATSSPPAPRPASAWE